MTFLWILLAVLFVACWLYFGMATSRKGHYWTSWIGFIFPILWIVGGSLGKSDAMDQALADFAELYADQNELDYAH